MFMFWDGGRHYETKFLGLFTSNEKNIPETTSRNLNVVYTEEALDKRREISRGFMTINQIENDDCESGDTEVDKAA